MPGQETAGGDENNDPTEEATAEPARGYHEPLNFYEAENGDCEGCYQSAIFENKSSSKNHYCTVIYIYIMWFNVSIDYDSLMFFNTFQTQFCEHHTPNSKS